MTTENEQNPELKLVFDEPKQRVKPPAHFADLSPEERKVKVAELGIPAFRANQMAIHFFTHHNDDPESWSDIPKLWFAPLPPMVARPAKISGSFTMEYLLRAC